MPSFRGATGWLNSEPLGPAEMHGQVVLVDFWTLTCINWLRTEPYVRARSQAYRNDGLVVIGYRFHARDAHLVLSVGAREAIRFRLFLDGEAPGQSHGVDVDEDGNGLLRDSRLYQLVRQHDAVHERTLGITFLEPGAEAYVFTFG